MTMMIEHDDCLHCAISNYIAKTPFADVGEAQKVISHLVEVIGDILSSAPYAEALQQMIDTTGDNFQWMLDKVADDAWKNEHDHEWKKPHDHNN